MQECEELPSRSTYLIGGGGSVVGRRQGLEVLRDPTHLHHQQFHNSLHSTTFDLLQLLFRDISTQTYVSNNGRAPGALRCLPRPLISLTEQSKHCWHCRRHHIMFSRRVVPRLTSSTLALRPFSSTQWPQRSPALSDVEPNKEHIFDTKQREFREQLAENVRRQREQERVSASTTTANSANAAKSSSSSSSSLSSNNDHTTILKGFEGLGSLSTATTGEEARKQDEANSPNKKKPGSGRFSSLIYGTEEGREMDRDIERSFSQVLARGKYVHSIVFHEVKPDKVDEYVELVGGWYPRMAGMPENKVHLVGSWRTEVGDCDTFGTSTSRTLQ